MTAGARPVFDTLTDVLDLPPGFEAVGLRELGDAIDHAVRLAPDRGAGTLVWVRRFDVIEFAVVLEPEEALATARRAIYPVTLAAVRALLPGVLPEKPIEIDWPGTILIDGGIVGGAALAAPETTADEDVPDWLVAGVQIRTVAPHFQRLDAPGAHPLDERFVRGTSLSAEGYEEIDGAAIVAAFARHLMAEMDRWQSEGFAAMMAGYASRLVKTRGIAATVVDDGDLIERKLEGSGRARRRRLVEALAKPGWRDPKTGEVWL